MSARHGSICPDAAGGSKKKILLFRDGKLQCYREIWLQHGSAFILIGETCAGAARLRLENVTLFSHLCTDYKDVSWLGSTDRTFMVYRSQ